MPKKADQTDLSPETQADRLVATLRGLKPGRELGRYISHIRFPLFKNIERDAQINFSFPVTALVGPNGCGKTSALHALYGAPLGQSTSDYWFSTEVDPIKEGNGQPNRFIYGHWLDGADAPVETRKARVGKSRNRRPGYFEPTKAVAIDQMDTAPFPADNPSAGQSKDRWNPVVRSLLYINFRSELSAFDKYLFWANPRATKTMRSKYERLQQGAKRLRSALEARTTGINLWGKPTVLENRDLSSVELAAVSGILGKEYSEARLIRHTYYGGDVGLSVRFRTARASYSEAFAGSGELAVASLVVQVLSTPERSLVLLDEPEVSLHPGAQEQLLVFLMREAVRRKHQVVFTTHSPALIRFLPEDAIKVFVERTEGRFDIVNSVHPYAAFVRLGAQIPGIVRVFVEDRLAKYVVDTALRQLSEDERQLFEVDFLPGGSDSYFVHRIPTWMHTNSPVFVVLDGDKRPAADFPDEANIPESQNPNLSSLIRDLTGCAVQLCADGGNDTSREKRYQLERQYLAFLCQHVRFLPRRCPEEIVLGAISPEKTFASCAAAKDALRDRFMTEVGDGGSMDIDQYSHFQLLPHRATNIDLAAIATMMREFLTSLSRSQKQ